MKAYKIVYRNYVVGTDAIEHSVIVQGWIRKCITISDLERNNVQRGRFLFKSAVKALLVTDDLCVSWTFCPFGTIPIFLLPSLSFFY